MRTYSPRSADTAAPAGQLAASSPGAEMPFPKGNVMGGAPFSSAIPTKECGEFELELKLETLSSSSNSAGEVNSTFPSSASLKSERLAHNQSFQASSLTTKEPHTIMSPTEDHLARGRVFALFDGVHDLLPWADEVVVQHVDKGNGVHNMTYLRAGHHVRVVAAAPAPIKGWTRTVNIVNPLPAAPRVRPDRVVYPEATFHFVENAEFEPAALPPRPAYVPW